MFLHIHAEYTIISGVIGKEVIVQGQIRYNERYNIMLSHGALYVEKLTLNIHPLCYVYVLYYTRYYAKLHVI